MKYFKIICIILCITTSNKIVAQSNISLETDKDEHCTYIKPTLLNISLLLFATNDQYVKLLEKYGYEKAASGGDYNYLASTDEVGYYRIITKEDRILMMTFSPSNVNMVSTFRNDIKKVLKDPVVEYEDGYEVYRLMLPYDGLKFKVLFRLKEETVTNTIAGRSVTINTGMVMAIIK